MAEQISDGLIMELLTLSDKMIAFPSRDVFRDWIKILIKSELGGISRDVGFKVQKFLLDQPDHAKWPAIHLNALTEANKIARAAFLKIEAELGEM